MWLMEASEKRFIEITKREPKWLKIFINTSPLQRSMPLPWGITAALDAPCVYYINVG